MCKHIQYNHSTISLKYIIIAPMDTNRICGELYVKRINWQIVEMRRIVYAIATSDWNNVVQVQQWNGQSLFWARPAPQPVRDSWPFHRPAPQPVRDSWLFHRPVPQPVRGCRPFHRPAPQPATQPVKGSWPFNRPAPQPVRGSWPFNRPAAQPVRGFWPFLVHTASTIPLLSRRWSEHM